MRRREVLKEPPIQAVNGTLQNKKSEFEKTPESAVKAFSGVKISEWLHRLEAIGRCFASGEAGYFPYHVVNGHIDGIGVK